MKKASIILALLLFVVMAGPAYCFVDYLFGGSSRGAIDNSVVGDLRAWWSGNPAYQFNPYHTGRGMPQQSQQAPPSAIGSQQQMGGYPQGAPGNPQYYQQGNQNPYVQNFGPGAGQVQAPPPPAYQNPAYRGYSPGVQQPAPQYQAAPQPQYQPTPQYQAAPQPQYQPTPQYQAAPQPQYQTAPQYQGQAPGYPGR
jgi:hypothetical protein